MAIIDFSSISFSGIKNQIEIFLRGEHNKSGVLFSPASPYGQILSVVEKLHQMSILYLKNAINQFDLSNANSNNPRIVRSAAILAGHNPTRSISSTGTLKFSLQSNDDLEKLIPSGRITFTNKTLIKNNTNSLYYSLNLGTDRVTHKITSNYTFFLPIIQGSWTAKNFTSDGKKLQTFSIKEKGLKDVENFNVEVIVGGETWQIKKHIWEMLPEEKACVVKTGFNGGIDVVFGNDAFGMIPTITTPITINYLLTDGSSGNIFRRTRNDWTFIGDVISGDGETIDISQTFNIDIYTDINFGANGEDVNFTRSILPIASNNFVLGLPQQYAYEIKKLGVFSHVNAYEKSNTIFIVATPNVRLFKNQNADYFNIDLKAFELDRYEKSKIDKYLKISGNLQLTRKYRIDSPKLSYYIMNVFVMYYSDSTEESVNAQILDRISEYFLSLSRIDRIPKLDIIRELSLIRDIHSVDIQFISKKNEDYHRSNLEILYNRDEALNSNLNVDVSTVRTSTYNPNEMLGIDPVLGDILFEPEELPIIRGGWYDRNNIFYSNDIEGNQLKSVNIINKGKVDSKNRTN